MSKFSASDAALEGFGTLRSQWRVVAGWAAFNLLAMAAIVIAFVIFGVTASVIGGADSKTFGEFVGGPLVTLGEFSVQLAIGVAVYRLAFRPEDRGFLYLRLGPDELRTLAVVFIFVVGLGALALLAVTLARAVAAVAPAGPPIVAVAAVVTAYWLVIRLGLVAPICVAERRLDFAKSWRLTRSKAWALIGMTLLSGCLALLLSVLVWGLFFVVTLAIVGFGELGNLAGPEGLRDHPGLFLLQAIAPLLFAPFVITLISAPWAAAYKALAGSSAEP